MRRNDVTLWTDWNLFAIWNLESRISNFKTQNRRESKPSLKYVIIPTVCLQYQEFDEFKPTQRSCSSRLEWHCFSYFRFHGIRGWWLFTSWQVIMPLKFILTNLKADWYEMDCCHWPTSSTWFTGQWISAFWLLWLESNLIFLQSLNLHLSISSDLMQASFESYMQTPRTLKCISSGHYHSRRYFSRILDWETSPFNR